jgi:demethylmenaquinone methyltransferase/2-methoxy-6-polyprenyl-1,4-benzoquinol methylase
MSENIKMEKYYAKRAIEYEDIYSKPERQEYIKESKLLLKEYFLDKTVLEIACGTGFWTKTISKVSKSILAIDINNEMLEIAKNKKYNCEIDFIQDDSYKLEKVNGKYDSLFAGFWFSHIPKSKTKMFLDIIYKKLNEYATIVFMDNLYVNGSNTPISLLDTRK